MKDYEESPSKKAKDIEATMKKNNYNLQHYSAMGSGVSSVEPSFKLGQGGLLNQKKTMPNHIQSRSMSVMQEAQGSHLGIGQAGGLLADGGLSQPQNMSTIQHRTRNSSEAVIEVPRPFGQPNSSPIQKFQGLKAEANTANGGVGVTFSNVVLGGGINPNN